MDRPKVYSGVVGNDFIAGKIKVQKIVQKPDIEKQQIQKIDTEAEPVRVSVTMPAFAGVAGTANAQKSFSLPEINFGKLLNKKLIILFATAFALLVLLITQLPVNLYSLTFASSAEADLPAIPAHSVLAPPNLASVRIQAIKEQSASLTLGEKHLEIPAAEIAKWINVKAEGTQQRISSDGAAILSYLQEQAEQNSVKPVNQIEATRQDGTRQIIIDGKKGSGFTGLPAATAQIAKQLMEAKGINIALQPKELNYGWASVASDFKWIDIDIEAKHMELYEGNKAVKSYLISAGAPETPTREGKFKIFEKLPYQDMWGYNPNGTMYFQPAVRWISYFDGAIAIHGNYWRPASWFGARNSSHGCVGIPNAQAKEVYEWAPLGTTVVVHK